MTEVNSTDNDKALRFEQLLDEFDQTLKIVDYYLETEFFYNYDYTNKNIKKIMNLLSDCSRIVKYQFKIS
jgi:hypothetical protein